MKASLSLFIFAAIAQLALSTPTYYGRPSEHDDHSGYGSHSRRCSPPRRPYHGGHDGSEDYYSVGHKVTYHCDDGYELYGSQYSTCQYSSYYYRAYWDNSAPYCKRKKHNISI